MMFTALTFNMQNGQVWDEQSPDHAAVRLEDTLAFLQEQSPDVIFLQEVERGHDGGRQVEPPPHYEWLKARLAGYDSVFGYPIPNPVEIPFGLGLAIFSRTPLRHFRRVDLAPADITFEYNGVPRKPSYRLLIQAETEIEGRTLQLLNTHLQAFFMIRASSNEHMAQRNTVADLLARCHNPALFAGDLNSAPGETVVEQFEGLGFRACQKTEITWRRMPFVLDHILYRGPLRLERTEVIPTLASDHHAVKSTFSFT